MKVLFGVVEDLDLMVAAASEELNSPLFGLPKSLDSHRKEESWRPQQDRRARRI